MSKKLVTYFSVSGITKKAAETLAEVAGADLYEIKPLTPYTKEDLDWKNENSRSSVEMNNKSSRPAILDKDAKVEDYDVVFVGFPIWWHIAPTIINTFLESYNFAGKTIILFATSGGSDFGETAKYLQDSVDATAIIKEGKILNGEQDKEQLTSWLNELGI